MLHNATLVSAWCSLSDSIYTASLVPRPFLYTLPPPMPAQLTNYSHSWPTMFPQFTTCSPRFSSGTQLVRKILICYAATEIFPIPVEFPQDPVWVPYIIRELLGGNPCVPCRYSHSGIRIHAKLITTVHKKKLTGQCTLLYIGNNIMLIVTHNMHVLSYGSFLMHMHCHCKG